MSLAEAELAERQTYIGGSEAHELLGFAHYGRGCARALAYRKLGTPEDTPSNHNGQRAVSMRAILARGQRLENYIAQLYMDVTSRSLIRRNRLVRHPDHLGAAVHTDRIVLAGNGKPTGDAEIKSHAEGPFLQILRSGLPAAHNLQLQWSLFCTGHTWGAFIICGVFGEMPLKHFDLDRDAELMEIFARAVDDFWNRLARNELPPQLTDPADIRCKICPYRLTCRGQSLEPQEYQRLLQEQQGKKALVQIKNDDLDEALTDRALILSEIEALNSDSKSDPGALQLINKRVKELIGNDQTAIVVNDHWTVYSHEYLWNGLDQQRLKEEEPEMYKKYYVTNKPTGTRTLRVYATRVGKDDK